MAADALLQFYHPIPRFGEKFANQVPDMRDNSNSLATLVRAAFADTDGGTNSQDINLSGWALGEKGFRNKVRTFYDKAADEFKIQFNTGTQSAPVWNTCVRIREDDCRFIVVGKGGLQLDGGFYGGSNLNTGIDVRDSNDPAAGARNTTSLVFNSNAFYTSGTSTSAQTMVNLINAIARKSDIPPGFYGVIVQESDGSNTQEPDDTIQFAVADFVVSDNAGKPLVTLESDVARTSEIGPGFYGITVAETDGDPVFTSLERVDFNTDDFYVTQNTRTDRAIVNFRGSVTDHGALTGLGDDDHLQYFLTDGTKAMGGALNAGAFRVVNIGAPVFDADAVRLQDLAGAGPGFYGILIKESISGGYEKKTDELTFDTDSGFYITSAGNGKPLVSLLDKFSATQHFASAAEWTFTHNLGSNFVTWGVYTDDFDAMFPSRAAFNDKNVASFYFSEANAGFAVVRQAGW